MLIRQILYSESEREMVVYIQSGIGAQYPIIVEPDVFRRKEGEILRYLLAGV